MDIKDLIIKNNYDAKKIKKELKVDDKQLCIELLSMIKPNNSLSITNLTWTSKDNLKVLDNVSFNILSGSFHIFVGENGAGKSTTMKCIVGIHDNFNGTINFDDGIFDRSRIFFVPDKQNKFPFNIKVKQYLKQVVNLLTNNERCKIKWKKWIND